MMMWSGCGDAREQGLDRRNEIVGDGAAQAAVGELDDVLVRTGVDAARLSGSLPSTPTSPNSLMISARRRPAAFSSTWRIRVVLPAPRKPVTMVTGIFVIVCRMPHLQTGNSVGTAANPECRIGRWSAPRRGTPPVASALFRRPVSWLVGRLLAPPSQRVTARRPFQWLCRRSDIHIQLRGQLRSRRGLPRRPHSRLTLRLEGPSKQDVCMRLVRSSVKRIAQPGLVDGIDVLQPSLVCLPGRRCLDPAPQNWNGTDDRS